MKFSYRIIVKAKGVFEGVVHYRSLCVFQCAVFTNDVR